MAVGLEFCLLGPVLVRRDGLAVPVPGGKPRAVLAALLLDAGELVTVGRLAEVLWGAEPPPSARVSVQNHVKRLRRALGEAGRARIATRPGGYVIRVEAGELDVSRFQNSLAGARAAARDRRWEQALAQASAALLLWRGEPLADAGSELLTQRAVPYLAEIRLQAWEARLEAEIELGRYAETIVELRRLVAEHPLREHLHALLMLALRRCGRRADALTAYQAARRLLIDELGAEPGPELRREHMHILASDRDAVSAPGRVMPGSSVRHTVVPRQLPAPVRDFVGRGAELATLNDLADRAAASVRATLVITAIGGMAGIGKTALAVHWAHQVARRFPDGQLYVNLHGFGPSNAPMPSATAIRAFLDAFGVRAEQIPVSPDAQAALYRSLLSGRKMLVVLDNARDAEQVRPLLPGSPGCLVVVTSRRQLAGLAATEGAYQLTLDLLTEAEARELLAQRLGADRLSAEPGAAVELVKLCGRLPLALTIAASRRSARPELGLGSLARELGDAQRRLDALDAADAAASLRAVFSWSLRGLPPAAAGMFRLLGLHPGPEISIPAAASMAGIPPGQAGRALYELAGAHLITEHAPGRFSLHDLLHAYAAEQAATAGQPGGRNVAIHRALDYYLHAVHAANRALYPTRALLALPAPQAGVVPEVLADAPQAQDWLRAERRVLLAVIAQATRLGYDAHAWQMSFCLAMFLDMQGYWQDWAAIQHAALSSAERLGDMVAQARVHLISSHVCARLESPLDAHMHLGSALSLYQQLGDRAGQARIHVAFSLVHNQQGEHRDAFGHAQYALVLYWSAGDRSGLAQALNAIGWSEAHLGNPARAIACCRRALDLHAEMGNGLGKAETWDSLGYAYHQSGDYRRATACYARAISAMRKVGNNHQHACTRVRRGDAYLALGRPEPARNDWQFALAIFEEENHPNADPVRRRLKHIASAAPDDRNRGGPAGAPVIFTPLH